MRKNKFAICLFFASFVIFSQNIYACQCFEKFTPLIVDYSKAEFVFVGKVLNIKKFGNESEKEAYYPKLRTVEFEIQKVYKGTISSTEKLKLNTDFNPATCGFGVGESPKKGQNWIVFASKDKEKSFFYFGGLCDPSSYLEKASDISELENRIFSVKDRQVILGSIVDDMKIAGIVNIEVILKGEGQNLKTHTDKNGLFYFPVSSIGKYAITIRIPFPSIQSAASFQVKETSIKENTTENARILKSILNYEVQLKAGEFNYNEIKLFLLEPKSQTK